MLLPFDTPTFRLTIAAPPTVAIMETPTKSDYYRMMVCTDKKGTAERMLHKYGGGRDIPFTAVTAAAFISSYIKAIEAYREENMDVLRIPEKTDFGDAGKLPRLPCITSGERLVHEHTGLDFMQQAELPVTEYWLLLADAVKMRIMQRSDGDEYLEQCYLDMHQVNTLRPNIAE